MIFPAILRTAFHDTELLTIAAMIVFIVGTLVLTPPRENGSGGPLRKLYGREKTQDELVKALDA